MSDMWRFTIKFSNVALKEAEEWVWTWKQWKVDLSLDYTCLNTYRHASLGPFFESRCKNPTFFFYKYKKVLHVGNPVFHYRCVNSVTGGENPCRHPRWVLSVVGGPCMILIMITVWFCFIQQQGEAQESGDTLSLPLKKNKKWKQKALTVQ